MTAAAIPSLASPVPQTAVVRVLQTCWVTPIRSDEPPYHEIVTHRVKARPREFDLILVTQDDALAAAAIAVEDTDAAVRVTWRRVLRGAYRPWNRLEDLTRV